MDKKLTVRLNQQIIKKAKRYAKTHDTSLSKMIETYFDSLTSKEKDEHTETTPLVKSLSGVIELPQDFDYEKSRLKYLQKKYK